MSSKINMFWYKMPNGEKNFGDDLGPYLVSQLSGSEINYVPIVNSTLKTIILYIKGLFDGKYKFDDFRSTIYGIKQERILITIGSIISSFNSRRADVWGTGIMFSDAKINNANFYAVRGKYTQKRLKELGYNAPEALGDPALLLPVVLPEKSNKKYKLGIIPHYIHYEEIKNKFSNKDVFIVNLLDDIEKVVSDITCCEQNISTSLHGIIVSHAYQIPCLWYRISEKKLAGDDVKFLDYFSSVDIKEYSPFELSELNLAEISAIIESNPHINSIQNNLEEIQMKLLKVAPFPILNKYLEH